MPSIEDVQDSHDKILRTLAKHFLQDLVEILFPEIADKIDYSTAKFIAEKLFTDFRKGGHLEPDVVVELRAKSGERQVVLFHGEMENQFRKSFEKRLRTYHLQLSLEYPDCAVLTSVIYRLGGPSYGIEKREVVTGFAGMVTSRFYYVCFSLSRSLAEEYVDRPQALAAAFAALMKSAIWDKVEQKIRCYEAIERAEVDTEKRYLLVNTVDNYLPLSKNEEDRFDAEIRQEGHKEVTKMIQTLSEALADQKAEGVALGKAEGVALGKIMATREAIALLARSLHKDLPNGFLKKLDEIDDIRRLYEILESIPRSKSLQELLP